VNSKEENDVYENSDEYVFQLYIAIKFWDESVDITKQKQKAELVRCSVKSNKIPSTGQHFVVKK